MTVESGHEPIEWESAPRPTPQPTPAAQPVQYNSARHGSHVEESPELLRWRADLLMDEMMMGGVDVSAADGNRTFSGVDSPVVQRPQPPTNGGSYHGGDNGRSPRDAYARNPYDSNRTNGGNGHANNGGNRHASSSYADTSYANTRYESQSNGQPRPAESPTETNRPAGISPTERNATERNVTDRSSGSYPSSSTRNDASTAPRNFDTHTGDTRYRDASVDDGRQANRNNHYDVPDRRADSGAQQTGPSRPARPEVGNSGSYAEPLRQPPTRPMPPTSPTPSSYDTETYANGNYANGSYDSSHENSAAAYGFDNEPGERGPSAPRQPDPRQYPEQASDPYRSYPSPQPMRREDEPAMPSTLRTTMDGAPAAASGDQSPRTDRLYAVEQQYEQFRREQSANIQPVEITPSPPPLAIRPPLPPLEAPTRQPTTAPRITPQPVDEHTRWATGQDKWEYQDFSDNPGEEEEAPFLSGYAAPERRVAQESALRHDPAQFVSAMSVFDKKRSTLLPRSSELDIDTLHREISDLHGEIAALLPVGNETGERARHLLDKAYSILQSDPMRSAEVEYYMQQVRTIVHRLYQARQWSDLYRQRLHVYLWGWMGLSAVLLIARFVFQVEMEQALMWLLGVQAEHLLVAHWATFIGTACAGALGGAIGALYTMQTHARGEYSFFDRKYGLRGLILPFMGLIVGALGYLLFGLIFALVGIDPSQSLTAAIMPTVAAFAFGFSQESIYGTRN